MMRRIQPPALPVRRRLAVGGPAESGPEPASGLQAAAPRCTVLWFALLAVLLMAFAACDGSQPKLASAEPGALRSSPDAPVTAPMIAPDELSFAKNFRVFDHGDFKVVELRNVENGPWREKLVLVRRGDPAPPLEAELADAVVIETPVRSIATNAVSDLSRLRALGFADRVVGIATAAVYDEEIFQRFEAGEVTAIGHPGHGQPNLEALLAADPDLTLILSTGSDHAHGLQRIRSLGLTVAPSYAFSEPTFLGRAEWIVYIGLFFEAEDAARAYFEDVAASYLAISERAKEASRASPPVAFWGGPVGGNRWWAERNGPEAALLADAGAINPLADPSAGPFATLDTASVLNAAAGAELWITSALDEREWDRRSPVERFVAYRSGRIFHNRQRAFPERDAWDWNETAISRPDLALADLVSLLHPGLLPDHELYFFGPVARR